MRIGFRNRQGSSDQSMNQLGEGLGGRRRGGGFKIWPLLLFAAYGLYYFYSNQQTVALTGRAQLVDLSLEEEAALGLQSYQQILNQSEVVTSGAELERVRRIGQRLAAAIGESNFEWEFNLIRSNDVNAFCLPGGKVAVFTGILPVAANDDGLAVIMGHEIAHAVARHGAERMAQQKLQQLGQVALSMSTSEMDFEKQRMIMGAFGIGSQFGLILPFSRKHESEADYMGLIYLARACFNPEEAPRLWERMAEASQSRSVAEFMSTHPNPETRIQQFNEWMEMARQERARHCDGTGGSAGENPHESQTVFVP